MRIVTRIIAISRATRLGRQLREIDGMVGKMPRKVRQKLALFTLRELAQAGRSEFPHLYGTPPEKRYAVWGSGTDIGMTRAHSDSLQVRMRGIALWVAVAFYETRDAEHAPINAVHRQVLRLLRELKETVPAGAQTATGTRSAAEAAA